MSQGVHIFSFSYLLPVEQLLQLAVQQLQSKMVQIDLDMLHPTLEVGHISKGQFETPLAYFFGHYVVQVCAY